MTDKIRLSTPVTEEFPSGSSSDDACPLPGCDQLPGHLNDHAGWYDPKDFERVPS